MVVKIIADLSLLLLLVLYCLACGNGFDNLTRASRNQINIKGHVRKLFIFPLPFKIFPVMLLYIQYNTT